MQNLVRLLREKGRAGDSIFVFPSETVAEFWRREGLSGVKALRTDRFISWDSFKEKVFPGTEERKPINAAVRTIFSRYIVTKNKNAPFLSYFIRPEFRETSEVFAASLQSFLPHLKMVSVRLSRGTGGVDPKIGEDIGALYSLYSDFLRDNYLYEPVFEDGVRARIEDSYIVVFPEVIDDFTDFETQLRDSGRVGFLQHGPEGSRPSILEYANSYQEIRALLLRIGEFLDAGGRAEDVAVSFAGIDTSADYLLEQAKVQGIPLRIRQGRCVSELPGGTFAGEVSAAAASEFHVDDVKRLLLDSAYPWKDPKACRKIIESGLTKSCYGGYTYGTIRVDPWRSAGPGGAEARELRASLRKLLGAKSFRELRTSMQIFAASFFDTERWKKESLDVFQHSLDILADLSESADDLGVPIDSPFAVWSGILGSKLYVPKGGEQGVGVYPYRVAAGIRPPLHLVANCSQEKSRLRTSPGSFLPEDVRMKLGIEEDDFSEPMLSLYGNSGEEVVFSYSVDSRDGISLPPSYFVMQGSVVKASALEHDRKLDAASRERDYWRGISSSPFLGSSPLVYQKRGFLAQLVKKADDRKADISKMPLPSRDTALLLAERITEGGFLVFSPTSLEAFANCPFQFLFEKILRLPEELYDLWYEDPRMFGIMFHEGFRALFQRIQDEDGAFDADRTGEYLKWTENLASAALASGSRLIPLPPARAALGRRLEEYLKVFIQNEAESFPGWKVVSLEGSSSLCLPEIGMAPKRLQPRPRRSLQRPQ